MPGMLHEFAPADEAVEAYKATVKPILPGVIDCGGMLDLAQKANNIRSSAGTGMRRQCFQRRGVEAFPVMDIPNRH